MYLSFLFSLLQISTVNSYCYNGCSGHGTCRNYHCTCFVGFLGEDCRIEIGKDPLPALSAGEIRLTSRNFTSFTRSNSFVLVGFSSHSCERCVTVEQEYLKLIPKINIPFARVDADKERGIVEDFPNLLLPALYLCGSKLRRCVVYDQDHIANRIEHFVKRLLGPSTKELATIQETEDELSKCADNIDSIVIGFFRSDGYDDELEEYQEAAMSSLHVSRIQFHHVKNSTVVTYYQKQSWFLYPPAVVVQTCSKTTSEKENVRTSISLDDYYGSDKLPLQSWIQSVSLPLVGELLPSNYPTYEARGLPMLIGFFNLSQQNQKKRSTPDSITPNKKWSKERILRVMGRAAKKYKEKIMVVFTNGALYEDRMRSLGIFEGIDSLPAFAMNIMGDGNPVVPLYLSKRKKNNDDRISFQISNYCTNFLQGRLPLWNSNNTRKKSTSQNELNLQKGIREHFSDNDFVIRVTTLDSSFNEVVLDETVDVVVLFHAEDGSCPLCEHLAPYYKKLAKRMRALKITSVKIARMDLSKTPPPNNVIISQLPVIVLYRAYAKTPPYTYFSGVAKVRPLMDWLQKHAGKSIQYGVELPQFDDKEAQLFKQQIKARETSRAKQKEEM
jgi:thiol-disulfide isomerase/thioredoxin